ncbi:hypothetical protein DYB32_002356 [Aphanomyces invadans]|uniref:Nucleoporin Nup88 n=1 Tax=Aphanomyces invadans TaxID=157072 RepID=A0A418B3L6_9STRA|nr:hypothetical protein DYB32_002356 [Aphanomyces invadans]
MHRPGSNHRVTKKATSNAFKLNTSAARSSLSASVPGSATSVPTPATESAVGLTPTDSFAAALATASTVAAATLANVLPEEHVSLFCLCETNGDLVFVGAKGRLCHINIHASKPSLHDLSPTNASDVSAVLASASRLSFNSHGTKVLLQTNQGNLYVFNLPLNAHHTLTPTPDHVQVVFADDSRRVVKVNARSHDLSDATSIERALALLPAAERAQVKTVVPDVYEVELRQILLLPTVKATSTTWHPLSDSHVVVLTSTDELHVYATNESTLTPEQTHVLSFPPSSASTTAVTFGPPQGWESMTCYILRSNGDLFALTPLVPFDAAAVPSTLLQFLHQVTDGRLTHQQTDVDSRILLKAQKHWLSTVWQDLPAPQPPLDGTANDDSFNDQPAPLVHVLVKTSSTPEALATLKWPLQLQGPFRVGSAGWSHPGSSAQSVAAVAYSGASPNNIGRAPVLAFGWSSGHVTLREIHPRWQLRSSTAAPTSMGGAPSVYVVECLSLGATNDYGKIHLTTHPFKAHVVYALHATGVHVLHLTWMNSCPLAPPFTTAVHRVLSIAPSATAVVVGAAVLYSVERGHVLAVLYASGKWELMNVSAKTATIGAASPASPNGPDAAASSKDIVPPPLATLVDQLQTKYVYNRVHVEGGATAMSNTTIDTFKFVQGHVPALLDQVAYIEAVSATTKTRMDLHREWRDQQDKDATALSNAVDAITSAITSQCSRVQSVQAKQAKLNGRAAAVLQALKENQAVLSKAEIKYKQDLQEMAHVTRRLVPRITQLNLEAQTLLRTADDAGIATTKHLSADRARICHDVLAAETQLIADTTARLHDLVDRVATLRLE